MVTRFLRRPVHPRLPGFSVRAAVLIVGAGAVWMWLAIELAGGVGATDRGVPVGGRRWAGQLVRMKLKALERKGD